MNLGQTQLWSPHQLLLRDLNTVKRKIPQGARADMISPVHECPAKSHSLPRGSRRSRRAMKGMLQIDRIDIGGLKRTYADE
jgi:hypothetical protein